MARKLPTRPVPKPWGRCDLPAMFGGAQAERIGEIWFDGGDDLPLLVKYLFTSERLSIQVHPDDEQARARHLERGKSECWFIVSAEPGAALGLGLTGRVDGDALRAAALDGSIERMLSWRPVKGGDFFMVPAGTIHAIGAGIALLELQQNSDTTYRLYDYGRPRELHLDDGVEVASVEPYPDRLASHVTEGQEQILSAGPHFTLVHGRSAGGLVERLAPRRRWVMPLEGTVRCAGLEAIAGDCLLIEAGEGLEWDRARVLVAAAGPL